METFRGLIKTTDHNIQINNFYCQSLYTADKNPSSSYLEDFSIKHQPKFCCVLPWILETFSQTTVRYYSMNNLFSYIVKQCVLKLKLSSHV